MSDLAIIKLSFWFFLYVYIYFWWDYFQTNDINALITFGIVLQILINTIKAWFVMFAILYVYIYLGTTSDTYSDKSFYLMSIMYAFKHLILLILISLICYVLTKLYIVFMVDKSRSDDSYQLVVSKCVAIVNLIFFFICFNII